MVDKMNEEGYKYRIHNTHKHFGHIVMPTGTGKSGVSIEDIIYDIENYAGGTLIINISCPILKLTQQLLNDLFQVIQLKDIKPTNIRFFVNSSDDGGNYETFDLDMDANPMSQFEQKHSDINIIASCNKSLWKFVNLAKQIRLSENDPEAKYFKYGNVTIKNYLDEAHLLPIVQFSQTDDGESIEVSKRVDLESLCESSNAVYAFTATPDETIVSIISDYEVAPMRGKRYILHILPREAIQKGDILPPLVKFLKTKEENITIENLVYIMDDAKREAPDIYHKILITAFSKAQLKLLYEELTKLKYKVFCICDPNGGYEDFERTNIKEFSDEVENYQGDCFVIHIKMLREGIDIKGLTDCVLFSKDHGSQDKYRMTIQTIGRVLRCLKGERGKSFVGSKKKAYSDSKRLKKFGGVYFISPAEDPYVETVIRGLVERYYGLDTVVFAKGHAIDKSGSGSYDMFDTHSVEMTQHETGLQDEELNKLMMQLRDSINSRYGKLLSLKLPDMKSIYKSIKNDCDKSLSSFNGQYDTVEWLMNKEITNYVYKKIPSMLKTIAGFDVTKFAEVL